MGHIAQESTKRRVHYMPGLDGLRAIAVLSVIAYHLNLPFAPGGLLGVAMFFVLSGYLITDILVMQWKQTGRLDLKDFWLRRARRLLPALLFMLVVVMAWVTLWHRAQMQSLRGDVFAALLYMSNWWSIFHHVSYFASFGPPSPLGHLWSLAVEEQFYVLWPLLLLLGVRISPRRGWLAGLILTAALASALAMALLYQPGTDPSRVYYGTDTRAFELLIGAALAVVWPSRMLPSRLSTMARRTLDWMGFAGLILILYLIYQTNEYEGVLYRGGFVVISLTTAVIIAVLAHPDSRLGRWMGCLPLRWLGTRSYGIYLWHYPVIVLTSPAVNTTGIDVQRAVLQVAASVLLADLSYRFVEVPIRHGAAGRILAQIRSHEWRRNQVPGRLLASTSALAALGVSCFGMVAPLPTVTASSAGHSMGNTVQHPGSSKSIHRTTSSRDGGRSASRTWIGYHLPPKAVHPTHHHPDANGVPQPHKGVHPSVPSDAAQRPPIKAHPIPRMKAGQGVTAIGDSVMVDAAPYLQRDLPGIIVDGLVGRQMVQLPSTLAELRKEGRLGNRIIIELGTNGPFTQAQLMTTLRSLGKVKQIYLVNTRVPRPWQNVVNSTLVRVASAFPHTTIINWYADSAGKDALFYPDGVHLNPKGAAFYASMVTNVLAESPTTSARAGVPG